ncbi:MAG TPA: VOC family protein [Thermoanaerobaculia bacterium]|nr:VOC family protein [Thermoanaerobaculia bacterium]
MAEVTSHAPGAFCWIELGTTDQKAAKDFYTKLFGWSFTDNDMGPGMTYTIFHLNGRDAAACYTLEAAKMPGVPPHWMLYVATADADASARRAGELGGKVNAPAFDVMDFGRMAVLADPTGGNFCVWQAKANRGIGVQDEPGAFCWGQLNTNETAKAEAFYTALFGWRAKTGTGGGMTYTEWVLGGKPIGGMMAPPDGARVPAHWLPYFAVADCDAAAARAVSLGARTYVPPASIEGTGRFAVLADPQGAVFAIYRA